MPFNIDFATLDKTLITFIIVSYCAGAIGKYFIFHKVKENGYNGVLPVYSDYVLFEKCWNEKAFLAYIVSFAALLFLPYMSDAPQAFAALASMVYCILALMYSVRLIFAFGKGYAHLVLVCIIPIACILTKSSNIYVFFGLFTNPFLMLALGFDKKALFRA